MLNVHRNHTIHTNSNSTRMVKQKIQDPNSQSCSHESNWTRWQVWFLGCQLRIFFDIFLISETKMTEPKQHIKKLRHGVEKTICQSLFDWPVKPNEPKESQLMIITNLHAVVGLQIFSKQPIRSMQQWKETLLWPDPHEELLALSSFSMSKWRCETMPSLERSRCHRRRSKSTVESFETWTQLKKLGFQNVRTLHSMRGGAE